MATKIIILGTGGSCLDILDIVRDIDAAGGVGRFECVGFLDDNPESWGSEVNGVPVLGPLSVARDYPDCQFVNGIGSPKNFWHKPRIVASTGVPDDRFATLIHPLACVAPTAQLGQGVVIYPTVTVGARARVGNHVLALPGSIISHDNDIGDHTCLTIGACVAGGVTIGKCCYLGARCTLFGDITIGSHCLIGMGAVVLKSVEPNSVVAGHPARVLRPLLAGDEWRQ